MLCICWMCCVPLAVCVQQSPKTGHVWLFRVSVVQAAPLFGAEKVMEVALPQECEAYFGWMTWFRQASPNFCHLGLAEGLPKLRET